MKEKTHWMQSPNKNYLGHWDLPESGDMVVTIKSAQWEKVKNPITNKTESKRVIRFVENVKPLICNQTNAQSIVNATGIKFMEDSEGATICIYVDTIKDKITKEDMDCLRIKRQNPYTLTALDTIYKKVSDKLTDSLKNRVIDIINKQESTSYEKAIKTLKSYE